jgi:hypothetical protein
MTIVAFMTDAPRLLSDREIACVGGGTLGGGGIGPAPSPNFWSPPGAVRRTILETVVVHHGLALLGPNYEKHVDAEVRDAAPEVRLAAE